MSPKRPVYSSSSDYSRPAERDETFQSEMQELVDDSDFSQVYARMLQGTGCRTQTELAALLGIRRGEIARARRAGYIPTEWLLRLVFQCLLDPDWVICGTGRKFVHGKLPARSTPRGAYLESLIGAWYRTHLCLSDFCKETLHGAEVADED